MEIDPEKLFFRFYSASTEEDVIPILKELEGSSRVSWTPYGNDESFFGVIENQQASPIPALIEKITNSIDAILMRQCYEHGIDPKSKEAPRSINEAISAFFPKSSNWDLPGKRKLQAESIQILADGPRKNTSLIIYDDGEGQHPDDFEKSFLSLLRGNKNEIQFVQGKYNMGGAGAVVFCGKNRYQLVASKRFDKTGDFGFTIIRKHPLTPDEELVKKNTWYEFLKLDGVIPRFNINELDLGLNNRKFTTGTILKLYSYDLPPGSRSVISRDLNQSINEYLFEPALPIITVDKKERYPDDKNLERDLYGLKRRMEEGDNKYIKEIFSETHKDSTIGEFKATIYLFKPRLEGKTAKESKESIRREFFKNNMTVLFSLNGQVHGNYTSEFIIRSLKFPLLKDYIIIHVDCTKLKLNFRNELFMASRDRLKQGEESNHLRKTLSNILAKGHLKEIYKEWKDSITSHAESANDLLKDFSKSLPLNSELMKLLSHTFDLDKKDGDKPKTKKQETPKNKNGHDHSFNPQHYPTSFDIDIKSTNNDGIPMVKLPLNGDKTILFSTDVEDQYFDRVEDPGQLKLAILSPKENISTGGDKPGSPKEIDQIIDITHSSPSKGKIRVNINPTKTANIGDSITVKATLTSPNGDLEQIFITKISDKKNTEKKEKEKKLQPESIGLPKLSEVYKNKTDNKMVWDDFTNGGFDFDFDKIMYPLVEGDILDTIFINMDSSVLKSYKSKLKTEEQITIADRRYLSSVYFHTIFLYMITKNRKYTIQRPNNNNPDLLDDVDISEYLRDIFDSYYSEFLLSFEMSTLIESLE